MKHSYVIGCFELIFAQCCVGVNVVSGKSLIGFLPVFLLLTVRFAIGFTGAMVIAYLSGIKFTNLCRHFMILPTKDKWILVSQAICGGFLFNVLILYGMKTTSATSAGIISSIVPVVIFILAAVLLQEEINLQKCLAVVIVVIGLFILNSGMTSGYVNQSLWGNCFILLAVIPEALFTILSKYVEKKTTEIEAVILINLFNIILLIPFFVMSIIDFCPKEIDRSIYYQMIIYGFSGGVMFFLFWYKGLTKINANTAAVFTGVMPVSTTLLAFIFLHEPMSANQITGMIFIIVALFVGCVKSEQNGQDGT